MTPSLSSEEYEVKKNGQILDMIEEIALKSGSADLAENLIAYDTNKKRTRSLFSADVTYKVGDMICLGSLGDFKMMKTTMTK